MNSARLTGSLSDVRQAVTAINGLGIAFHGNDMYFSPKDTNHNGIYGERNETRVPIVTGIPTGDHSVDNI